MTLDQYRSKRRFKQTPEPAPEPIEPPKRARSGAKHDGLMPRRFAIHKHDATKLHFDLRLEHAGVLLCWAVPRGPSLDPAQRRLAVQTEDHPLKYLDFEGLIPEGNYGAGPMILWDRGHWVPDQPPEQALAAGKLKLTLQGERLQGRWTLVRTGGLESRQWLMIKEKEPPTKSGGEAPDSASAAEPVISVRTSVCSGRTLDQIRSGAKNITRQRKSTSGAIKPTARSSKASGGGPQLNDLPQVSPKLPTLVERPPKGEGWLHELKLDGYRMQACLAGGQVKLITRGGHDWTDRLPELADAVASLPLQSAVLDGEVVALTPEGATDFSALQAAFALRGTSQLVFFLFDLLYLDGQSLMERPLLERKKLLEPLVRAAGNSRLQYLDHVEGAPAALWQACRQRGLEGIVSKRTDRPYRGGRSKDWLKVKHRRRDRFVVGGVERSGNAVAGIGSLALGYFDTSGNLHYCGKVGGGWSQAAGEGLLAMLLEAKAKACPFITTPALPATTWVQPRIVVEVDFAGVTADHNLRQASLVSVLDRLPAASVVRNRVSDDLPEDDESADAVQHAMQKKSGRGRATKRAADDVSAATVSTDGQLDEVLQHVKVTNPQRVLFPESGITKLDLIAYMLQINQWLLPHIQNRLVSLVRCPAGITGETFFQRHPGRADPRAMRAVTVPGESRRFLTIGSLEGLVAAVQMNVIEIHPWGSRRDRPDRPDRVVLDLDPDPSVLWPDVVDAAWMLRDALQRQGLTSFVKTTGGKGLHIVIPVLRRYTWEKVAQWCQGWVDKQVAANPRRFTGNLSKRARQGKIFIDHLRNRRGATSVAAYCVRARPGATVSVPLFWEELTASLDPQQWTIRTVPQRLMQLDRDPWAKISSMPQPLK